MKNLIYVLLAGLFISCSSQHLDLNVMSYNIRYDNPGDSLNNWKYRKDVAAKIIKAKDIDILGAQEVMVNQLADLKQRLPEYNALGVGRLDGKDKGEFSALLYKKDRFEELSSGNFWLSETPEVVGSKGWDGACERVATWAILKDKKTGKEVFAINTHLDHVGKIARQEGVALLLKRANELSKGLPIILTGDFNATPDSDVIKHVVDPSLKESLYDTRTTAKEITGTKWTFHGFGNLPEDKRSYIDYIFVSKNIKADKLEVLPAKLDGIYLSDHVPVVARLEVE